MRPRQPKFRRSSPAEMADRASSIIAVLEGDHPQSVRHVFYRLTSPDLPGAVEKTEAGYGQIQRLVLSLRREGRIPRDWVVDQSRMAHWNDGYESVSEFMLRQQSLYRRSLWQEADEVAEVWAEARSMLGILLPTCREFGVPVFPAGGFSSESFLFEAAAHFVRRGRPTAAYHVGDFDDAGLDIGADIERRLRVLMEELTDDPPPFRFVRLAVREEQIGQWNLPTKPPKGKNSKLARTVEAETVPAGIMRGILRETIESHLPPDLLARTRAIEAAERQTLSQQWQFVRLLERYGGSLTLTDGDGETWGVGEGGDVTIIPGGDG